MPEPREPDTTQGGERDVAADLQEGPAGVPEEPVSEGGMRGEDERSGERGGGMVGEG